MSHEAPPRYVVDASIVVKWYSKFGEEEIDKANKLMNEHIEGKCLLMSSSLVLYELSNALRFNPNFEEKDVLQAVRNFLELEIRLVGFQEIFEPALEFAFQRDITVYDAAYVALSQTYQAPLIIADYKLLEKIKDLALVMPLKEIPSGRKG